MRKLLAATLLVMALSAVTLAQLNEGRNAPARAGGRVLASEPETDNRPYSRSTMGKVLKVNADEHFIVIDEPKGGPITFIVDKNTRIKADKKTELGSKKNLKLADYQPGQTVKIIYRIEDRRALEVRLKPAVN